MNNEIFKKKQSDLNKINNPSKNTLNSYFEKSDHFSHQKRNDNIISMKPHYVDPIENDRAKWFIYKATDHSFTVSYNALTIRKSLLPTTDFKGYKLEIPDKRKDSIPQYEVTLIS